MPPSREKLLLALDMFEAGVDLVRQRLRRETPSASAAEIEVRVNAWLEERPGAPHGDSAGRPIPVPSDQQ